VEGVCSQAILYPLETPLGEFAAGTIAITFRKRPGVGKEGDEEGEMEGGRALMRITSHTVTFYYPVLIV